MLWGFPGGSGGKESACNAVDLGSIPGSGRSPAEGMATGYSSILAWIILWTEEPGGLLCNPWGHKESDKTEQLTRAHTHTHTHTHTMLRIPSHQIHCIITTIVGKTISICIYRRIAPIQEMKIK